MDAKKILIAEDEEGIRDVVRRGLENFGYQVETAEDGQQASAMIADNHYDLVMLDIRMPGPSGLEVCRQLRDTQGYQTPVLMLTALATTDDIVMGLQAGADDYVTKPFKFTELLARIEALLRRVEAMRQGSVTQFADLRIDPVSHQAVRGDLRVDLSTKEYRLLEYFITHHDEALSRRQLLRDVWDRDFDTNTNIVDVYVKYLRTKVDEPFSHKLIHTVVGVGYMMRQ